MTLTEDDIRPRRLMEGLSEAIRVDREWLLMQTAAFVKVTCPACGSRGALAFQKLGFSYERCSACRTTFMNPRPPEKVMHEFYVQSHTYSFWNEHIFPASESARREKIFAPRADRVINFCRQYNVRTGSILEVGAGFGTFCAEIVARGIFREVVALEMTPQLAQTCRDRGLRVIEQPIETAEIKPNSFDVVVAFETLEHLF